MKKRVISSICSVALMLGLILCAGTVSQASDEDRVIDGSRLIQDEESVGIATPVTKGVNLQTGYSKLRRVADGVIYAGGTTIARHDCKSVQVACTVERAHWEDTEWEFVDMWIHENNDTYSANTSKRLEVEGGWYYRVRSLHAADGDAMESRTDGLYVPEF